ncbi:hypothetical protein BO94DRAFT_622972 [Aspergillus sclerotioniger CBS 115572]|uniref:Uncharacterized protein n=1 Tax=Aspergillus sclerotioniger CBS 115572 TaxID=1450535 RepID=A0A317WZU4_9EURO|nr:hypothetical protein BO94DRAFT_622972 [Aspergillus sclerotioniger CBS 115572]PWY91545.1 hypothetical protein BO94DRAFT_622972 [Aspergillus sclerotioniger CBS 115572]
MATPTPSNCCAPGWEGPRNAIVSRCIGKPVVGDVAVVRSSSVDVNDYEETFSKTELVRTTEEYRNKNARVANEQRERTRIAGLFGVPEQFLPERKIIQMP